MEDGASVTIVSDGKEVCIRKTVDGKTTEIWIDERALLAALGCVGALGGP